MGSGTAPTILLFVRGVTQVPAGPSQCSPVQCSHEVNCRSQNLPVGPSVSIHSAHVFSLPKSCRFRSHDQSPWLFSSFVFLSASRGKLQDRGPVYGW
ncbi:hypothetical protein HOY82DRAFT_559872 [Tuber indicum]|nr:hypothetical protein HOY82DRAFT_559872 [Tuber indicum]